MKKIIEKQIGDFKGTLYLYSLGYGYKIKYQNKIVDQSCVYFAQKEEASRKMETSLKTLSGFNNELFDLERL